MAQNQVITQRLGPLPAVFADYLKTQAAQEDRLNAGIQGGFAVLSYRGKSWHVKSNGEEHPIVNPETGEPKFSVEVVILKQNPVVNKTFYEKVFEQGGEAGPPDCFSLNGVTPDPTSPKRQNAVCGTCRHNQFGTRRLASGEMGKGKACQDNKRLAVVPAADLQNEIFGGPMLLRVPPASFQELNAYDRALTSQGVPYFGVATRIGFDLKEPFPLLVFRALGVLTEAEAVQVIKWRSSEEVARVLSEPSDQSKAQAQAQAAKEPEPDPHQIPAQREPLTGFGISKAQAQPVQAQPVQAQPQPQPQKAPEVQAQPAQPAQTNGHALAEVSNEGPKEDAPAGFDDLLSDLLTKSTA